MRKSFRTSFILTLITASFGIGVSTCNGQCEPRAGFYYGEMLPNNGCGNFASYSSFQAGEYFRMPVLSGASYSISTCGNAIDTQITGFQGVTTATSIFYNDDNGPECSGTQASINITPGFNDYTRVSVNQYNCQLYDDLNPLILVYVRQDNNLAITSSTANMCEGESRALTANPAPVGSGQTGSGSL